MFGNRSLISYGLCALYRVFLAYLYIGIDIMAVTAVGCSASETKGKYPIFIARLDIGYISVYYDPHYSYSG